MRSLFAVMMGLVLLLGAVESGAQTLTFSMQNGQVIAGPKYQFEVWVKSNDGASKMGSALVYVNYNTAGFGTSVVTNAKVVVTKNATAFGATYGQNASNDNTASRFAFSWTYTGGAGSGVVVPSTGNGVLAFTVTIDIANTAVASNLSFETGLMDGENYLDDEATTWTVASAGGLNDPLPIQLSSFTAAVQQGGGAVQLKWSTASETNNYGFEVQKSLDSSNVYETIANSFIAGHGTSVEAHSYSFTDGDVKPGVWYYRLKQTDLDGTVHYSDRIQATSLTGVTDRPLPTAFALDQNYPNPFNPSTTIEFALPKDARVSLDVYNVIGQRVASLVNEVRQAGYHSVQFNAGQLASGLYIYRIAAGDVTMVKKMMLTK